MQLFMQRATADKVPEIAIELTICERLEDLADPGTTDNHDKTGAKSSSKPCRRFMTDAVSMPSSSLDGAMQQSVDARRALLKPVDQRISSAHQIKDDPG
jgi:hypothetical protein